jgi:heme oxygenase
LAFDSRVTAPVRRLKVATSDLHVRAEQYVHILDADATEDTYRAYLARMWGFHAPIEERFGRHRGLAALGFAAAARRKQELLAADLEALGTGDEPPRCAALPATTTVARALGVAYVLEGSTLGGRFILTRMQPRLGHLRGVATHFLEGYRGATGAMWRGYCAMADAALAEPGAYDEAEAGARETFATLIDWLAEPA